MAVTYLPPNTGRGSMHRPVNGVPLWTGPRYVFSASGMANRWHRPRSAYRSDESWAPGITYNLWCGPYLYDRPQAGRVAQTADELPPGEDACAVCVGKAYGAGQDALPAGWPRLRYDPRWVKPPKHCPGSRRPDLLVELGPRVARCLVCGVIEPTRSMGGPYSPRWGIVRHLTPAELLIEPCPWHAWNYLGVREDDTIGCRCEWREPVVADPLGEQPGC